MTGSRLRPAYFVGLLLALLAVALQGVQSEEELEVPSEDLCRPYIEKALKDLGTGSLEQTSAEAGTDVDKESQEDEAKPASEEEGKPSKEDVATEEDKQESVEETGGAESGEQGVQSAEAGEEPGESAEAGEVERGENEQPDEKSGEVVKETEEDKEESVEQAEDGGADSAQEGTEEDKDVKSGEEEKSEEAAQVEKSEEEEPADAGKSEEEVQRDAEIDVDEGKSEEKSQADDGKSDEAQAEGESAEEAKIDEEKSDEEAKTEEVKSDEEKTEDDATDSKAEEAEEAVSKEEGEKDQDSKTEEEGQSAEQQVSGEEAKEESKEGEGEGENTEGQTEEEAKQSEEAGEGKSEEETAKSVEKETVKSVEEETAKSMEEEEEAEKSTEKGAEEEAKSAEEETDKPKSRARREVGGKESEEEGGEEGVGEGEGDGEGSKEPGESEEEPTPEEDLIREIVVPENLRPRDHINQLLKLDEENEEKERAIEKHADVILKELKRVYDNAIQPLESLYKYRDLSNRHFGDPEIFSKPLVLFMGPWSGGKSSIINYLLDIEYSQTSLRTGGLRECFEEQCKTPNGNDTGAEPSPAYFNIIMHGEEEEILDGTQLAADWTFSGLQKFGQGLLDRLKGLRLDNKLLEKVNIVEIPGILEIRKQVQRLFPFNDACQWFIDRADIIFLVYDPSKLDVGPETEAILDQLKGREHQTRIILNKADQVKPEELMRVQGALIWNISPLMSSAEPPIMYSTSLWSLPYEAGAPTRLLYAQERAFLRDLRTAIDKRVEHKIASARRFAVRVRNHAKMVDCYLTTYYNHKTFFGNKKEISDKITDNPQDYHIYEGLSTLKNISRYDLPDPDVYRDFFRLNPLYDFPLLSSTCTYFRGCPINRLDVAIAYDLPELVGKYKKSVEQVIHEYETSPSS
ncbi:translation initiation factor IF-2 isoform X1 [Bombus terrestris]|uniref:Translation initiation factor IF-2 isoform X1 n=1 Tax=Bombus terrestris TaxID=30195 RepID=A0A9B2JGW5_BOMTE|nr:translation initiation factor IF-2 isoform X1 [Bombus terrestris]